MKLSGLLKNVLRDTVISVSYQPPTPGAKPITWTNPRFKDGMDAPVAKPKVPGIGNAPPAESDVAYVTRLYRDLLGRAPDAEGMRAHLTGLARGMSRADLEQVFLNSDEYKALHAPKPPAPEIPEVPQTPEVPEIPTPEPVPPMDRTAMLRKLIAADIWTAGHRVADERDYSYWLPMLEGPCDSGFVTSGQMTGVEYYHRRMLGWQAGGEDSAKFGPYAGSPDAIGPVPSAVEVMGGELPEE